MNIVLRYKIINVILIFVLLGHLGFLHNILHNYVLCFGSDGHIQIENLTDLVACESQDIFEVKGTTSQNLSNAACEDLSLEENCFEEEQFISINKISIRSGIEKNNNFVCPTYNHSETISKVDANTLKNGILESYTTISLVI